jgi:hypothetical protein
LHRLNHDFKAFEGGARGHTHTEKVSLALLQALPG